MAGSGIPELTQHVNDFPGEALRVGPDLGLPEPQHSPAHLFELSSVVPVAIHVSLDLRQPVVGIVSAAELLSPALPIPAVPEVTITEDGEASLGEDDVRSPGQGAHVLAVPAAGDPEGASKEELALGVGLAAAAPGGGARLGRGGLSTFVAWRW